MRRRADVAFTRYRIAVMLDGCYWHGCPDHYVPSKTNVNYWTEKIAGNRARDADTDARLRSAGWTVVRVWEHEEPALIAEQLRELLSEHGAQIGRCATTAPDAKQPGQR